MSEPAEFTVDDHAGPQLVDEDQAGGQEDAGAAGPAPEPERATPQAFPGWQPYEFARFYCGLFNIGAFFYGPVWLASPDEVMPFAFHGAQLMDKVLPKGAGGAAELGVGMVTVAGGVSEMVWRRREVIRRGPLSRDEAARAWGFEAKAAAPEPPPAQPAPNAAPREQAPAAAAEGESVNGRKYRLPNDLAVVAGRTESPYASSGIEGLS